MWTFSTTEVRREIYVEGFCSASLMGAPLVCRFDVDYNAICPRSHLALPLYPLSNPKPQRRDGTSGKQLLPISGAVLRNHCMPRPPPSRNCNWELCARLCDLAILGSALEMREFYSRVSNFKFPAKRPVVCVAASVQYRCSVWQTQSAFVVRRRL